jgi:peptide/nickel transport system permease protein
MLDAALFRRIGWPILLVAAILLVAIAAPLLAPYDPIPMDVPNRLGAPSWLHLLGQDEYGRDVLSRLIYGARVSLSVALLSAAIAAVVGVVAGLVGGYFGGMSEILTLRVVDIVLCFPPLLLALLIVTVLGPGIETLTLVLSVLFIPGFARVTYGEVLSTKNQEYVEATRALGARAPRILFNAILPNIIGPILVQFSLTVAAAVILESGLSFLGLGVVPPAPSWGLMIRGARGYMEQNPMGLLWPCAALVFTIWSINALCDSLRDAIDPRTAATSRSFWRRLREAVAPGARVAPATMPGDAVLSVEGLKTSIVTPNAVVRAVDDVSFAVRRGETLAVVGESGSGKSMTGLSMMGLLPKPGGRIIGGAVQLATKGGRVVNLATMDEEQLRTIRGEEAAMIFQEPMTSLNPVHRIGTQIVEAIRAHRAVDAASARRTAHKLLERVGIPDPARCLDEYPHQLSGGMRQRAMIALALSCEPVLLIADEPTTALDVTIQAQILDLMRQLQHERPGSMAVIFITHNLGIVAEMADRVIVMYAGQIVEEGPVAAIFVKPHHPYTRGLLDSVPRPERGEASETPARRRLATIPGTVPNLAAPRHGCAFAPRCALAIDLCRKTDPALVEVAPGRRSRCLRWSEA